MAIPAAEIALVDGRPVIITTNEAFRRAGLNEAAALPILIDELTPRLGEFLNSDRESIEFPIAFAM